LWCIKGKAGFLTNRKTKLVETLAPRRGGAFQFTKGFDGPLGEEGK